MNGEERREFVVFELAKRCFRPLSHLTKISGGQYASELAIANNHPCAQRDGIL